MKVWINVDFCLPFPFRVVVFIFSLTRVLFLLPRIFHMAVWLTLFRSSFFCCQGAERCWHMQVPLSLSVGGLVSLKGVGDNAVWQILMRNLICFCFIPRELPHAATLHLKQPLDDLGTNFEVMGHLPPTTCDWVAVASSPILICH